MKKMILVSTDAILAVLFMSFTVISENETNAPSVDKTCTLTVYARRRCNHHTITEVHCDFVGEAQANRVISQ